MALFARIFSRCQKIHSVIEFGANVGTNLNAIRHLMPEIQMAAIEINEKAVRELNKFEGLKVYAMSVLDFSADSMWDFVFTKGVLIHVAPSELPKVYDTIYRASRRYICVMEYYNPTPVEVPYRGHHKKLFKRDFPGEILDRFGDLELIDYGFVYHRDNNFNQDDISWFLMEKA